MRSSARYLRVAGVILAIFLTACTPVSASDATTTEPRTFVSPLDEYLSAVWGTEFSLEERTRRANESNARFIELITQCMHEQGFAFDIDNLPFGIWFGVQSVIIPDDAFALDDAVWVGQWGYGIMSSPFEFETAEVTRDEGVVLSDSELDEFSLALLGRGFFNPARDWNEDNCQSWATERLLVEIPEGLAYGEEFAPLFDAIDQMEGDFRQEVSNADFRWAQCMIESGHPGFQRQWEAQDIIRQESFDVLNRGGGLAPASESDEELLRLREIELALADLACRESTGFTAEQNANRLAFETRFVEDNRPFLEALRSAAERRS